MVETDVLNLIELLMNQLLKLDGIVADGDVKLQRKMQVSCVEFVVVTSFDEKKKKKNPLLSSSIYSYFEGKESTKVCGDSGRIKGEELYAGHQWSSYPKPSSTKAIQWA